MISAFSQRAAVLLRTRHQWSGPESWLLTVVVDVTRLWHVIVAGALAGNQWWMLVTTIGCCEYDHVCQQVRRDERDPVQTLRASAPAPLGGATCGWLGVKRLWRVSLVGGVSLFVTMSHAHGQRPAAERHILISDQTRLPAELKHISKRRKRN